MTSSPVLSLFFIFPFFPYLYLCLNFHLHLIFIFIVIFIFILSLCVSHMFVQIDPKARATREVLRRFCTKFRDPPRYYSGPEPEFEEALFETVRKRIEIILTDAAPNELLASNVSRGARDPGIEKSGAEVLLPCLKLVARDHAHAFRRVIKRPFQASEHLSNLMQEHVLGKTSPVRVIDDSFIFRQWFEDEVAKLVDGNVQCHNLKSAAQMQYKLYIITFIRDIL